MCRKASVRIRVENNFGHISGHVTNTSPLSFTSREWLLTKAYKC
jgi:hypothetical protein